MTEDAPPAYHQVALLEAALEASRSATGSRRPGTSGFGQNKPDLVEFHANWEGEFELESSEVPPPDFSAVVASQMT